MVAAAVVMATTQAAKKRKEKAEAEGDGGKGKSAAAAKPEEPEKPPVGGILGVLNKILEVLNSLSLQTCLYFGFVIIFQSLANTLRIKQEYYLDKHVMDRIVENHFDSSHNTFESVRRIADIYEWGNNVLWPGLFADMGPCNGVSSAAHRIKPAAIIITAGRGCNRCSLCRTRSLSHSSLIPRTSALSPVCAVRWPPQHLHQQRL